MVMVAATGHLSGAHFNLAVTLAFAVTRHFAWREVPAYVGAQLLGAIGGALSLLVLFGPVASLGATVPSGSAFQSFGLELLLTAVLMFVIISVATDTRAVGQLAALAIGATVALDALRPPPALFTSPGPARLNRSAARIRTGPPLQAFLMRTVTELHAGRPGGITSKSLDILFSIFFHAQSFGKTGKNQTINHFITALEKLWSFRLDTGLATFYNPLST